MAFIEVDSWRGATPLAVFGPADAATSTFAWRTPGLAVDERSMERGIAGALSLGMTWVIVSALMLRTVQAPEIIQNRRIETLQLVELDTTPPGQQPTPAPAATGGRPVPPAARTTPSPIDTSMITLLSVSEWTVSRIAAPPAPAPVTTRSAGPAIGAGFGVGAGEGGSGAYDPYAGASPARRVDPVSTGLDQAALAELVATIRRQHPGWRGQLRCTVRVSVAGYVVQSECVQPTGSASRDDVASAVIGLRVSAASTEQRVVALGIDL